MILGQQLKALRESAGLTYRDLRMHHNTIKAIETGASYNSLNRYIDRLQKELENHKK
jgi:transcriptional regulator with XRE-family HTH domain